MRAFVGLSGCTSLLRRCSEHGSAANPPSTSGGHAHGLPQDPSSTPRVAPLPSKWPYRLAPLPQSHLRYHRLYVGHPSRLVDFLPLGGPRAQQNIQRGLHTALLLTVTFFTCSVPWCFIVSPGGSRSHQARRSRGWLLAKWFYMPGHVHRGVHVVLPTDSCLLPLLSLRYHCWSPVRHRTVPPFENWLLFQRGQSHPRVSTRRTLLLSCLTFWSLAEPFSDMQAPFREWTGGPPHRHGPLSRAQHLRTSASYRWWYLEHLHRTVLTTLGIALRGSFAVAPL